jgi:hypothetical protein
MTAKARQDVYYKTDSHWNSAGAYAAYSEIMARLHIYFQSTDEIRWSQLKQSPGKHQGDLALLLSGPDGTAEDSRDLTPESGWAWKLSPQKQVDSPVADRIRRPDPVPPTVNENAALGTLVAFHDSFYFSGEYPYLSQHFKRTFSVWTHGFDYDLVAREHPALVIQECAERLLTQLRNHNTHAD